MQSFTPIPSRPGAPVRHYVLPFGRFKGVWLSTVPARYLAWLLSQPSLAYDLRFVLFEVLQECEDQRVAVDLIVAGKLDRLLG
jgi:Putative quorum-sensing-regulated virulence factor